MWFRRAARARFEQAHAARFAIDAHGVVIGADTFALTHSNNRAVLLLHGFNDTPQSMRYLGERLHEAGWSVLAPRLPGHGVTLAAMARESRAASWRACVAEAYRQLRTSHDTVVLCGLSMGGALATLLCAQQPEIPALVLLAPYLGMPASLQLQTAAAWIAQISSPYLQGRGAERSLHDPEAKARALGPGVVTARTMTELRTVALAAQAALPLLRTPTLYLQSREDNRIDPTHATREFARIGSTIKEQRWLSGCGHIISADYSRDEVARQVLEWFEGSASIRETE